jgi:hypothetical protein
MGLFIWGEETHVSLQRKQRMLEAAWTTPLFPWENWVSFFLFYFLFSFMFLFQCLCYFSPVPQLPPLTPTLPPPSPPTTSIPNRNYLALIWVSFWKKYLLHIVVIMGAKSYLLQIGLFNWVQETHESLQTTHHCLKLQLLAHCFIVRTEFIF